MTAHIIGAFSTQHSFANHAGCSSSNSLSNPRQGKSCLQMALTEEYIQMQVNGDTKTTAASSTINKESTTGTTSSENIETNNQQETSATREKPLSDILGYTALTSVQTLASVVGSAGNDIVNDPNNNISNYGDNDDMDGFNKGAFGIANIFSGRHTKSRRSKLIAWQRQNLSDVRREIVGRSNALESSRMGPVIAALPSSQKANSANAAKKKKGDGNIGQEMNSKKDQTLITTALQTLEKDMALLDVMASLQPQLSGTEVGLLLGAVVASGLGPIAFPGTSVTEVLAPAAAAFTASITIGSEYIGRVAVADGKE